MPTPKKRPAPASTPAPPPQVEVEHRHPDAGPNTVVYQAGQQLVARVDPGPPPRQPQAPSVPSYAISQALTVSASMRDGVMDRASARVAIREIPLLREPREAAHYKAELLQWLDDLDAYEARLG